MELYTYKARSLAEALHLVRDELGPDASVLYTREIGSPLARLLGGRLLEVTASPEPCAPSRLPDKSTIAVRTAKTAPSQPRVPAAELQDFRRKFRNDLLANIEESSLVEK